MGRWPNHQSACCTNSDSQHPCKNLGKVLICNLRTGHWGTDESSSPKLYGQSVYPAKDLWDQGKILTLRITLTTIENDAWHQPLNTHRVHVYHIYMHTYKYTLAHVIHTDMHIQRPNIWWNLRNICLCYNHLLSLFFFSPIGIQLPWNHQYVFRVTRFQHWGQFLTHLGSAHQVFPWICRSSIVS